MFNNSIKKQMVPQTTGTNSWGPPSCQGAPVGYPLVCTDRCTSSTAGRTSYCSTSNVFGILNCHRRLQHKSFVFFTCTNRSGSGYSENMELRKKMYQTNWICKILDLQQKYWIWNNINMVLAKDIG